MNWEKMSPRQQKYMMSNIMYVLFCLAGMAMMADHRWWYHIFGIASIALAWNSLISREEWIEGRRDELRVVASDTLFIVVLWFVFRIGTPTFSLATLGWISAFILCYRLAAKFWVDRKRQRAKGSS